MIPTTFFFSTQPWNLVEDVTDRGLFTRRVGRELLDRGHLFCEIDIFNLDVLAEAVEFGPRVIDQLDGRRPSRLPAWPVGHAHTLRLLSTAT